MEEVNVPKSHSENCIVLEITPKIESVDEELLNEENGSKEGLKKRLECNKINDSTDKVVSETVKVTKCKIKIEVESDSENVEEKDDVDQGTALSPPKTTQDAPSAVENNSNSNPDRLKPNNSNDDPLKTVPNTVVKTENVQPSDNSIIVEVCPMEVVQISVDVDPDYIPEKPGRKPTRKRLKTDANKTNSKPTTPLEPIFKCDLCEKLFTRKGNLQRHIEWHKKERPHVCHLCPKAFANPNYLKYHIRRHIGVKHFKNGTCFKPPKEPSTTPPKTGDEPFKCPECDKTFTLKGNLKRHLQMHSGQRPFKCEICTKTFLQVDHLKRHIRTHTGEKPHQCTNCLKTFSQKIHLKRHLHTHACGAKCESCDCDH